MAAERFLGLACVLVALAALPGAAAEQAASSPARRSPAARAQPAPNACAPGAACCPARFQSRGFCRVGCPGPPPRLLQRVDPDLTKVARPYPSGVAILEVGIDEKGHVLSACVLRGVRFDFDNAAQAAALKWRWNPMRLNGKPIGVVMTVTVGTP
jgi:TonB family protein